MAAVEVLPSGKVVAAPSERAKGPNDNGPFTKLLDSLPSVFPKVKEDPFGECKCTGLGLVEGDLDGASRPWA